ncbi:hypothetical protein ACUDTI_00535 [Stenotrophomonas pavanii]|uniref:site-specific integrase n=1 Tax=Stenotrophomonas pavanii TaxID=487698 RepID=UPI0013102EAA
MQLVIPPAGAFEHVPKLQHVPILIGEDGSYPVEANRYLDERSNAEWRLPGGEDSGQVVPTVSARKGIAARLSIFLEWVNKAKAGDWRSLTFQEGLLDLYQPDLLLGTGSRSGRKLKPSTVNAYVGEACLFLAWAYERGYRDEFRVPKSRTSYVYHSATSPHSGALRGSNKRIGALLTAEVPIQLPSDSEVERWMRQIHIRAPIKALVFELILRCGLRISEANSLRVTCFPSKQSSDGNGWHPDWLLAGEVPMTIRYGTKGAKVSPSSDLGTRWRTVFVPIDLADRIWHYITVIRPTQLGRYHRGERMHERRVDRLWLGEGKNQPISNEMLRRVWKSASHCPPGWHPHSGRHYFAVQKIAAQTSAHLKLMGLASTTNADLGWLHGLMAGQVKMILSPIMGHVNERTTMRYLQAAVAKVARDRGHPSILWNAIIDRE